eukprot:TRINITY_DN88410_c0_g1_i1.p1 TRINITY_DN88410_c0_g1~~TRINITY_DN88410_c0_g1_i1.p1  ORF type:complete len:188 (-),score=18.43 TRINITY_DN88410_c0_g1_i1:61-624(-)
MKTMKNPDHTVIQQIKTEQAKTLKKFIRRSGNAEWQAIHDDHFDWWMFPVDEVSSYQPKWVVYDQDIAELQKDDEFMHNYMQGVTLACLAWGWDLHNCRVIEKRAKGQQWQKRPIRLYKIAKSLKLFGCVKEFLSVRHYALSLIQRKESFKSFGRDLSALFTAEPPILPQLEEAEEKTATAAASPAE